MLSPLKVSPTVRQSHPEAASIFEDAYAVEFLNLPQVHLEADLHRGLLRKLKELLIELGRDFFALSARSIQYRLEDRTSRSICCSSSAASVVSLPSN